MTEGGREAGRPVTCCVNFSLRETCPIAHLFFLLPLFSLSLPPSPSVVFFPLSVAGPPSPVFQFVRKFLHMFPGSTRFADIGCRGWLTFLSYLRHAISLRSSTSTSWRDTGGIRDRYRHRNPALHPYPQHERASLGASTGDHELINRSSGTDSIRPPRTSTTQNPTHDSDRCVPHPGIKGGRRTKDGVGRSSQAIHPRSIDASGRVLPLSPSTLIWRRGVGPDVLHDSYLFCWVCLPARSLMLLTCFFDLRFRPSECVLKTPTALPDLHEIIVPPVLHRRERLRKPPRT